MSGIRSSTNTTEQSSTVSVSTSVLTNPQYTRQVLSDGATINWDCSLGGSAQVTLAGNRTMAAPTNLKDSATYALKVIQDATGSRTLTWNSIFKWPAGVAPVLSTTAAASDLITCYYDGTNLIGSYLRGVA